MSIKSFTFDKYFEEIYFYRMSEDLEEFLSVQEVAEKLKLTRIRVNQLIDEGKLPAKKIGRSYVIKASDLQLVENRNKAGRPPKVKVIKEQR